MIIIKKVKPDTSISSASGTLKLISLRHKNKLIITFLLVILENALYLLYPLLAGFAINAIVTGKAWHAVSYAVMVFTMWLIGAARRSVDTRVFSRIYAELAVSVILVQRRKSLSSSTIAARVTLSREFVDFFEKHLPVLITSLTSVLGAALMLVVIELWTGIICLSVVAILGFFLPAYTKSNEVLFIRVNDRLEKEVSFIDCASTTSLSRHYNLLAGLRIRLSNREALGYLSIGTVTALLFGMTILIMVFRGGADAGHIYSVLTYLWMFAMSLDDWPQLLEKYSQLRDIGKRVGTEL